MNKSPIQLIRGGTKIMSCGMAFKVDLYSGCEHNCSYCYSKHLSNMFSGWKIEPKPVDPKILEQMFIDAFEKNKQGHIYELMRNKFALRAGSLTDNFQKKEAKFGVGLKLLQLLNKYDYPCVISTKGDIISRPEYVKCLKNLAKKNKVIVQFSLISLDEDLLNELEPGSPTPKQRLSAIKRLSENGIPTQIRIAPFIPKVTTDYEQVIEKARQAGCSAIIAEYLRIPPKKFKELKSFSETLFDTTQRVFGRGVDLWQLCKNQGGTFHRGYMKFPNRARYETYRMLRNLTRNQGMQFYICNECFPEFNEHPYKYSCCCGTEAYNGFVNFNSASANHIYGLLKEKKKITLNEIKENLSSLDWQLFEKHWNRNIFNELLVHCRHEGNSLIYTGI